MEKLNPLMRCEANGAFRLCGSYRSFELGTAVSGTCEYFINGKKYVIQKGDVFFRNTEYRREPSAVSGDFRVSCVSFEPSFFWLGENEISVSEYLRASFELTRENDVIISSDTDAGTEIKALLRRIEREYREREKGFNAIIKIEIIHAVVLLARELPTADDAEGEARLQQISRSMNYICAHVEEPLSLEKIAETAHMSRTYYCTAFKAANGITPWEFVNIKRVDMAKDMLKSSDELVLNIAMRCGFNNSTNFNRIFKKITGVTPKEYRKEFQIGKRRKNSC